MPSKLLTSYNHSIAALTGDLFAKEKKCCEIRQALKLLTELRDNLEKDENVFATSVRTDDAENKSSYLSQGGSATAADGGVRSRPITN